VAKNKTIFICSGCQYISGKWIGCCPSCDEWNSFIEQQPKSAFSTARTSSSSGSSATSAQLVKLDNIPLENHQRMISGVGEWDRVLGGGVLPGSFLILTGDPGIGKSTLLLQVAQRIADNYIVTYFSSEESLQQVKNRALRLGVNSDNLFFSDEACLDTVIATALEKRPALLILDSIQNCHLSMQSHVIPGTIGQLRQAAFHLMRLAKENHIAVLVTGHITKDGHMAGPKVLEHMVDGVFYLQAEDRWQTRMLRSVKNRFGTINEVGFFEMQQEGLAEVSNINQKMLDDVSGNVGSSLVCCLEGSRPLLLELQALVVESKFGMPQRVVTGLDPKRVVLIAAILEKYLHTRFSAFDIFFKVSGGVKIKDTSADLGIALALLSSYFQKALPPKSVAMGEISLTGLVKPANQVAMCVKEVEKFGLKKIFSARSQNIITSCTSVSFKNIYEVLQLFPEE